jgi:hypothetical protein
MKNKHEDSYQTAGGPPSKSWSLSKSTPRTSAGRIHHKNPKTQFWHNSGNVKTKNREKRVCLQYNGSSTFLTI